MKHVAAILLAILFLSNISAQEQLGLRLETYAGVSSLAINPAGNLNNPLKWDANLVGGDLSKTTMLSFGKQASCNC
ncbi:MAG: hypothetical protein IPM82_32455 [Saprospiraceae bacterium]|nr:hypothetical protein [Saprospiraceae bacterium]